MSTLTRRLTLAILGVAAFAIVLFGIPLAWVVDHIYQSQELVALEREASENGLLVQGTDANTWSQVQLRHTAHGRVVGIYNSTGQLVAGSGPQTGDGAVRMSLQGDVVATTKGSTLVAAEPLVSDGVTEGAIRAATNESVVHDRATAAWLSMVGLGLVVLVVAGAVGALIAKRLVSPLKSLARSAEEIGEGNFVISVERSSIIEIDRIAEALSITSTRVERALSRERAFSADVSHQLRTPLTALRVIIESSLLENTDPNPTLDRSLKEVDRLEQTITDLISLARETRSNQTPLDMTWISDWLVDTWRNQFTSAGRTLQLHSEAHFPDVFASAAATRQVLDVLLSNALTHGAGNVNINVRNGAGSVIIEVTDEGSIFTDRTTLFTRRASGSSNHRIGLSLAQSLVEAEGGALYLSSEDPTTFAIAYLIEGYAGTSNR